jgi:hypothetical protein
MTAQTPGLGQRCFFCQAPRGEPCQTRSGRVRAEMHADRMRVYDFDLDYPFGRPVVLDVSRATPDEIVAAIAEHLPD